MRRWLVTGAGGQLGTDVASVLADAGVRDFEVVALTRADLDVTDAAAVDAAVRDARPDFVVNTAAYTAVDAAEDDEERALAVNGVAPGYLASACARTGARLVHVSTDYVFDGTGDEPYAEDAVIAPHSAYGRTKAAGEQAVLAVAPDAYLVRTAWVYGAVGGNFVKTMARLAASHDILDVVDDQRGSPTWSRDLAAGLVALAESGARPGVYHCTNAGDTTWFGFARAIFDELGLDPSRVHPTTTSAFPRPAPRPAYSVLGMDRWRAAGIAEPRPWREALAAAFARSGDVFRADHFAM